MQTELWEDGFGGLKAEEIGVRELVDLLIEELQESGKDNRSTLRFLRRFLPKDDIDRVTGVKIMIRKVIRRAKGVGVWRRFDRLGKTILSLIMNLEIKLKSLILLRTLLNLLKRLMFLLSPVYRYYITGFEVAQKVCKAAYGWGNKGALNWMKDRNFVLYWGMFVAGSQGYRAVGGL